LYWITYDLYLSVFAGEDVPGLFYPFYALLFLAVVGRLFGSGLRADPRVLWPYGAFLFVVAASFLDFTAAVDFGVLQRVLAYLFGALILFQVGSRRGLDTVTGLALAGSAATSVWVIVSAARAGFGYRGDIAMDPNVVAFLIGIGAIMAAAWLLDRIRRRQGLAPTMAVALLMAVHVYAFLLLASRGVSLALAAGGLALMVRAVRESRRNLVFVAVMAVVAAAGFALPGGQGLVQRFTGERVESGGSRFPIWEATYTSYGEGDLGSLLLGHGFDSSKSLVARNFADLTSTHNAFLQMLYEFGVLGVALFVAIHVVLLRRAAALRNRYGLLMVGIVWFLLGGALSLNIPDDFAYWTALGLAMALGVWGGEAAPGDELEERS
ncbi:MAG: O-antigen ligase family protein, partial [Deinococcales bacterium]